MNRSQIIEAITKALAIDLNCQESNLTSSQTTIVESKALEGRRAFPFPPQNLAIVTLGKGSVISCNASRLDWMKQHLGNMDRETLFSSKAISLLSGFLEKDDQCLAGPDVKFACVPSHIRFHALPEGVTIEIIRGGKIHDLYAFPGFDNALHYHVHASRPDVLAYIARKGDQIIGVAGACHDSNTMWQIGIDVLEPFRGRGIARALVAELTKAVYEEGCIPYYSTVVSNLFSRATAISVGYVPVWVEMYARANDSENA